MIGAASGIVGVVLAGGQATRLGGGDKPLRRLGAQAILDIVLRRLEPQTVRIAISANGNPDRFAEYRLPVIADKGPRGQAGPLAGILSAMHWAGEIGAESVLTVAGDTPFFPHNIAERLALAARGKSLRVAVAASAGRVHPVFSLWPAALEAELRHFLETSDRLSVLAFLQQQETVNVDFSPEPVNEREIDPFFNINTPADLAVAAAMLEDGSA